MKDNVYFEESGDDKYMATYDSFEIQKMEPRNHFFYKELMSEDARSDVEKHVDFFQLWYIAEKDGKIFHLHSVGYKAAYGLPKKDEVIVGCFTKKDENTYVHVYKSVKSKQFPTLEKTERINVVKGGLLYKKFDIKEGERWAVSSLRLCDRFKKSLKPMKGMVKKEVETFYKNNYQLMKDFVGVEDIQAIHNQQIGETLD